MGMIHTFDFGGVLSSDLGLIIDGSGVYPVPERDLEAVEVPGRNGDLTYDNGKYKNIDITYNCMIDHFRESYEAIRKKLMPLTGYQKLRDSYQPDRYRMARLSGGLNPTLGAHKRRAQVTLTFNCKPQVYLEYGDIAVDVSDSIYNPTGYPSYPEIIVTGTGTIQINDQLITVSTNPATITIDGEMLEASSGDQNANAYVSLPNSRIELQPGENSVGLSGVTIQIIPHWWTL